MIKQADKKLGRAYERSRRAQDAYQTQLHASIDAERVGFSVSEDAERNIRQELQRRTVNLVTFGEGIEAAEQLIREYKIWEKTRVRPGESSSEVIALSELLRKLQRHQQLDEPVCAELAARLQAITPEVRKIAVENATLQKSRLIAAEREETEAYRLDQALAASREDQVAFIYRSEVLKFLRTKEYTLNPLTLASAIAGLPHIRARHSAQLCAKTQPRMAHSATYEIFQFVKHAWKRCRHRLSPSTTEKFEQAIRRLPKFRIVEGHRQPNWLRANLSKDWYYLRNTLQDPELSKLHPSAIPGEIVSRFLAERSKPQSPVTPTIAESERIRD
jgi:hypothetical protein